MLVLIELFVCMWIRATSTLTRLLYVVDRFCVKKIAFAVVAESCMFALMSGSYMQVTV